ncbi:MAG: autotransporter domain-containing protein, partial [Akkermansia sp.]|nr:autotransporter domain-containing protein [Akkermansia sp.]
DFEVTVVTGTGTVDSSGVTAMKYGSQNLTMNGAIGTGVGAMQYDTYRILSGHTASSSAIHGYDDGKGKNALITLADGGTLSADDATTETKVNATGGSINLSAGTLSGTVGGSTIVTVSGTATMSGDNSYTGGTTLNGAALTVTHANALGTGSIVSTGKSSLTVEGTAPLVLSEVISNAADGELTLAGAFDASALEYHVDSDGRIDLDGNDVDNTASGFARGVEYSVQIVEGGTTVNNGVSISHRDYLSRNALVLGEDGVARAGGAVDYTHFFLTGGDSAAVSEIADVSKQHQETLAGVTMDSGSLEVDRSIAVNATGGSISITDDAVLSGTVEDTAVSTAAEAYDGTISATMEGTSSLTVNGGNITVSGDNSYSGGTTVNGGKLVAGSNTAFGSGDVAVNDGGTLDLGACIITNRVLLSGDATLAHADGASNILLQSGANADFANGFELSAGKSLTVGTGMAAFARSRAARVGGTVYRGALTLGGGELTLNEHLTVEGHVNFGAGTTTIVNVAGWQGAEAGTELASFSSNSGYTEESLTLRGAAAGLVLNFDAATGVLSLVAAQQPLPPAPPAEPEFVPNLNRNQQEVYDTVKDIVAGGEKPEGELGKLVELISDSRNEAELRELLDAVGGSEYVTLMSSQLDGNLAHVRNLRNRMGSGWELVGNNYMRAMIEMFGQHSEVDGDAHGRGYTRSEMGGQFTLEFIGCMHMSSGVALASGHTRLNPDDALRQSVNNNYVDFYTTYRGHGHCNMGYSAKYSLGIGTHDYNLRRNVPGTSTKADADGFSVNFMHESAYIVRLSQGSSLQVFGVVESSFSSIGGFREKGAGTASLVMESQDAWATDITLGLRYVQLLDSFALPQATLTLQAGVTAGVGDTSASSCLHFAGAPDKRYYQTGADRNRWGYNLGVGLHVPVSNTSAFYMSGETILRGDSYEWNGNVGFQIAF